MYRCRDEKGTGGNNNVGKHAIRKWKRDQADPGRRRKGKPISSLRPRINSARNRTGVHPAAPAGARWAFEKIKVVQRATTNPVLLYRKE